MAERRQKIVLGLACLLRRNFFRFKLAAPNLISDVACDFRETANFPGVITKRSNDNLRFESRSVFSDSQTLITNVSATGSFAQIALWFAGGNIVCCVERREVFADDFFRGVTFDFLCTGVPGDDVAIGIQQVNGILLDAIHQDVELFGGLVQCGATGQLLKHRLRRKYSHTIRTLPVIWFPDPETILLKKQRPRQVAAVTAGHCLPGVFLFHFLYFCLLEDGLDAEEEEDLEEER